MAVAILDGWSGQTAGAPTGTLTVSSGSDRLLVVTYMAEVGTASFTSFTIGGEAPTGSLVETSPDITNQKIWTWYWDEAAITAMSDFTVSFSKTGDASKHDWDYAVFSGATGGAEFGTSVSETSANSTSINTTSASSADDYIVVIINRSSPNRDVTAYDNLSEEWIFRTDYCIAVADGVGGDDTVALTGDATAGDWFVQLLHIKSTTASGNPMMTRMIHEGHK